MKTFRLIGMALLALCVNFAACSDDEENGNDITNGGAQKHLVKMVEHNNSYDYVVEYLYDNEGKVSSFIRSNGETGEVSNYYSTVSWNENSVIADENGYTDVYTLANGLITNWNNGRYTSAYNSSRQLISIQGDDYSLTWENGYVTKFTDYDGSILEYTYYDQAYYGTPKFNINDSMISLLDLTIDGAIKLKEHIHNIFIIYFCSDKSEDKQCN